MPSTRGIRKRYVEEPVVFDDDDDEGEPIPARDDESKDSDFDAQADAAVAEDGDDDEDEEEGERTSDEEGSGDKQAQEIGDQPAQAKKQRNAGVGMVQSRKSFHDIPTYPLETRIVTRVYAGPLRRYARYSALRDSMYGPEYHRIKIIWDLEIRWTDFPVLPPMLPPEDPQGIVPSPWLPRSFELDQVSRGALWYDALQTHSSQAQLSRLLSPEQAGHYIPQADGDLVTLVGPWNKQKEFRLSQGGRLSLGPSGLPLGGSDSDEATPNGWMFDVGGIPLAVAWAPLSRQDIQVLAVATIPFADQKPTQPGDTHTEEATKTSGCIQFWEFVADKPAKRLAAPSRQSPRFLGAHCSDWGRIKRLQFCPVPLDSSGSYGLIAVLCGDGRARVVDAKWTDDPDIPFYSSSDQTKGGDVLKLAADLPQDGSNPPW